MFTVPTRARVGALAAVSVVALTACAADADTATTDAEATEVAIVDAWTKTADEGMTASFAEITNEGTEAITLIAVTTDASDDVELHETAMDEEGGMSMSQKDGGFTIEPGDTLTLEPGGNHIMLMSLTAPIKAGDEVVFELEFASGDTAEMATVAKDFAGANEEYVDDAHSEDDHAGSDH